MKLESQIQRSADQRKDNNNQPPSTSKSADKVKDMRRQSNDSGKKLGSSRRDSSEKVFTKIKFIFSGIAEKLRLNFIFLFLFLFFPSCRFSLIPCQRKA
jgi:hypothetical protein